MDQTLDNRPVPQVPSLDPKELDFFVERLAQILLMQVENENEHEEKTYRVSEAV